MGEGRNFRKLCGTCQEHNSVEHFLNNCPTLEHIRQMYGLGSVQSTLQHDRASEIALISFLKDAKLYNNI